MLELFDYYRSTASYRVRIALNLKELDYKISEIHLVNDGGQQHSSEYTKINPQKLVPALKTESGEIISQSLSIIDYLDSNYPNTLHLIPKDPIDRAFCLTIANSIACDIHPLNNLRVLKYLKTSMGASDELKNTWYHHWILEGFKAIENLLQNSNGKFCFGNAPTIADICLIPQVYNAHRFEVPMDDFPAIHSINEHCLTLDAFSKASPQI